LLGVFNITDSVYNNYGTTTFACPKGTTDTPVVMPQEESQLTASQLPPAKEIVHCTPKVPQ
jgi:hypothetical protein